MSVGQLYYLYYPLATYLPTLLFYFYQFYFARATLQYYNCGFSSENTINVSQHRMLFSLSISATALLFCSGLGLFASAFD